jgi:hypothetical protein
MNLFSKRWNLTSTILAKGELYVWTCEILGSSNHGTPFQTSLFEVISIHLYQDMIWYIFDKTFHLDVFLSLTNIHISYSRPSIISYQNHTTMCLCFGSREHAEVMAPVAIPMALRPGRQNIRASQMYPRPIAFMPASKGAASRAALPTRCASPVLRCGTPVLPISKGGLEPPPVPTRARSASPRMRRW